MVSNCFSIPMVIFGSQMFDASQKYQKLTHFTLIILLLQANGPFPSCCLSRFRSESWCSTIVSEMSLICIRIRNSFPFEWLCTMTRFETEACSNSEMGYSIQYKTRNTEERQRHPKTMLFQ